MKRVAVNGTTYAVSDLGSGPPLLLLHGFTGRASSWGPHLPAFRRRFRTIAPDLLGHGRSDAPSDPGRYALERQAADLAALLDGLHAVPANVIGYSMGGRLGLRLALDHPRAVSRLVLEGASGGIPHPARRAARRRADEALATRIERRGMPAFVDEWEAQPLFASERSLAPAVRQRRRRERLVNRAAGLAASLRGAGQGAQEPLHDRLTGLSVPVLLVIGELDPAGRERAAEIASLAPLAETEVIPGAGHAPHLERPAAFRRRVLSFLCPSSPEPETP